MHYEDQELFINCYGVNIHAKIDFPKETAEKMPILVIIPGFTGHIEERHIIATAEAAQALGMVTLRAEMYGHGKSEGEFREHNVLLWMTEAMKVIEYAKNLPYTTDVYLAGHSQGGLTAVLAGGLMCDVVKALIPMSPAMCIPYDAKRGSLLGNEFDKSHLPEKIVSPTWELSSNYVRAARMLPVEEAIKMYTGPVLVIHGTADEAVPYSFGAELAQKYENAKLVSIEDDTHCYDRHLDEAIKALSDFLSEQLK